MIKRSALLVSLVAVLGAGAASAEDLSLDVHKFEVIKRESGPVNYYTTLTEGTTAFIRSAYRPPMKTTVLGYQFPDQFRHGATKLRWRWRAQALPSGGNECQNGKGDSAAVVYLTWRSGLRWFTLKYVWSSVGPVGTTCDSKRNPFIAQDTVILRSGGPLNTWVTEEIDPAAEFRKHFRNGDPKGDVPALGGLGIMSDGDQTNSDSSADYADFVISR